MSWHLGEKLSRSERLKRFPREGGQGVVLSADRSSIISLKMICNGEGKTSDANPNTNQILGPNEVAFYESPNPDANKLLVESTNDVKKTMKLHLIHNGTDYDYGQVMVVDKDMNGNPDRTMKRFILRRTAPLRAPTPLATPMVEAEETTPDVGEGQREEGDKLALELKRGERGVATVATKRPRVDPRANTYFYEGCMYDSILEIRHAHFFAALGISFRPHCASFMLDENKRYTPDFYLNNCLEDGDGAFVEIKPCRPHMLDEWWKAEHLAFDYNLNVLLLYGDFSCGLPQSDETNPSESVPGRFGGRHYSHHNAVRGILWRGKTRQRWDDVLWCTNKIEADGGSRATYFVSTVTDCEDRRWSSPDLKSAYSQAAAWTAPE